MHTVCNPGIVKSVTGKWKTPQEKCIAIWRWGRRSRRQTSCATDDGRLIWDPILHYNSYGTMNCGVISGLNIASFIRLGYEARYVQLGDHTVSEVSWDKGEPGHYYLYHGAPQRVTHLGVDGWRCASDQPVAYKRTLINGASSYTDGFSVSKYTQYARQ